MLQSSSKKITTHIKKHNYTSLYLVLIYLALVTLGLFNLYSACAGGYYFQSQVKHSVIGITCFFFIARVIPYSILKQSSYFVFSLALSSLIIVLLNGHRAGGSTRWINIGGFNIQPSEFAKIALVFFIAQFLHTKRSKRIFHFYDL